jgi:hypothetical protein
MGRKSNCVHTCVRKDGSRVCTHVVKRDGERSEACG